jgi:adenylyl- and sulfurtransferase ThiI
MRIYKVCVVVGMIIVRHGEIFTKSGPVRRLFVDKLTKNIKKMLPSAGVKSAKWRIFVHAENEKEALDTLSRVFGVVSFSPCTETSPDVGSIKKQGLKLVEPLMKQGATFAVKTQRLTKQGPTSVEINVEVGAHIKDRTGATVNLDNPTVRLGVEIYAGKAYLFTQTLQGPGGLPLGTGGKVIALVADKYSTMAAWMVMKRGVEVCPDFENQEAEEHFSVLYKWGYSPATKYGALGVVTGARSTNGFIRESTTFNVPVFAPLVGLSPTELKKLEKKVFSQTSRKE